MPEGQINRPIIISWQAQEAIEGIAAMQAQLEKLDASLMTMGESGATALGALATKIDSVQVGLFGITSQADAAYASLLKLSTVPPPPIGGAGGGIPVAPMMGTINAGGTRQSILDYYPPYAGDPALTQQALNAAGAGAGYAGPMGNDPLGLNTNAFNQWWTQNMTMAGGIPPPSYALPNYGPPPAAPNQFNNMPEGYSLAGLGQRRAQASMGDKAYQNLATASPEASAALDAQYSSYKNISEAIKDYNSGIIDANGLTEASIQINERNATATKGAATGFADTWREMRGFTAAGMAVMLISNELSTALGDKLSPQVKSLVEGFRSMTMLGMAGGMLGAADLIPGLTGPVGLGIGVAVGLLITLGTQLISVDQDTQNLNASLDKMAQKDATAQTLANILGISVPAAQSMLDLAKNSNDAADALDRLAKSREAPNTLQQWQNQANQWLATNLPGMPAGLPGGPTMGQWWNQQQQQQAGEQQGAQLQWNATQTAQAFAAPYTQLIKPETQTQAQQLAQLTGWTDEYAASVLKAGQSDATFNSQMQLLIPTMVQHATAVQQGAQHYIVMTEDATALAQETKQLGSDLDDANARLAKITIPNLGVQNIGADQLSTYIGQATAMGDQYIQFLQAAGYDTSAVTDKWKEQGVIIVDNAGKLHLVSGEIAAMLPLVEQLNKPMQLPQIDVSKITPFEEGAVEAQAQTLAGEIIPALQQAGYDTSQLQEDWNKASRAVIESDGTVKILHGDVAALYNEALNVVKAMQNWQAPSLQVSKLNPQELATDEALANQMAQQYLQTIQMSNMPLDQQQAILQQVTDKWNQTYQIIMLTNGQMVMLTGQTAAFLGYAQQAAAAMQGMNPTVQSDPTMTPAYAQQLQGYLSQYEKTLTAMGVQQTPQVYDIFGANGQVYQFYTSSQAMTLAMDLLRQEIAKNTDTQLRGHYNIPTDFGYQPPTPWEFYAKTGSTEKGPVNYPWDFAGGTTQNPSMGFPATGISESLFTTFGAPTQLNTTATLANTTAILGNTQMLYDAASGKLVQQNATTGSFAYDAASGQLVKQLAAQGGVGPAPTAGMISPGNIDLANRPVVRNADGSISTVRSISIGIDNVEVLIPTVSAQGKMLTNEQAIAEYQRTGQNLGTFDTVAHADAYAEWLHNQQAAMYGNGFGDPLRGRGYLEQGFGANPNNRALGYGPAGHNGLDFDAPAGTPIYPAATGTVSSVGANGIYGNYIVIQNVNGAQELYGHMEYPSSLKAGQQVDMNTLLGLVGSTGNSTGPHLHFGYYPEGGAMQGGQAADPSPLFQQAATGFTGAVTQFGAAVNTFQAVTQSQHMAQQANALYDAASGKLVPQTHPYDAAGGAGLGSAPSAPYDAAGGAGLGSNGPLAVLGMDQSVASLSSIQANATILGGQLPPLSQQQLSIQVSQLGMMGSMIALLAGILGNTAKLGTPPTVNVTVAGGTATTTTASGAVAAAGVTGIGAGGGVGGVSLPYVRP